MQNEKFISPFIEFIENNFKANEHLFIIIGGLSEEKHPIEKKENIVIFDSILEKTKNIFKLSQLLKPYLTEASHVIIHSLFIGNIVNFFFLNKCYLKKCSWVIWGGDLYDYQNKNKTLLNKFFIFRKKVIIKKMHGLITYVKGDYELAKKWYGAKGKYYECIIYPSNIYNKYPVEESKHDTINIQIGNSADQTNNHLEVFSKLDLYKNENIRLIVPLSYGDQDYAKKIIEIGKEQFGDKFVPLTNFMPFTEYLKLLSEVDIAIFNHNRQQAMGNIITLIGLGKKVYMKSTITPWQMLKEKEIIVYDVDDFNLKKINDAEKEKNINHVKRYFSPENLKNQLNSIFEG